jgi:hypothetical protein
LTTRTNGAYPAVRHALATRLPPHRHSLPRPYRGVTERFIGQVADGLSLESSNGRPPAEKSVQTGGAAFAFAESVAPTSHLPEHESARYFALCERAWLYWSRPALLFVTARRWNQDSVAAFKPPRVRNAEDAAAAAIRCGFHRKLLDLATRDLPDADWSWQFEAARHVHASTEQALSLAARILDPREPSIGDLAAGISAAADALVIAISAGFIADAPVETRETATALAGIVGD